MAIEDAFQLGIDVGEALDKVGGPRACVCFIGLVVGDRGGGGGPGQGGLRRACIDRQGKARAAAGNTGDVGDVCVCVSLGWVCGDRGGKEFIGLGVWGQGCEGRVSCVGGWVSRQRTTESELVLEQGPLR